MATDEWMVGGEGDRLWETDGVNYRSLSYKNLGLLNLLDLEGVRLGGQDAHPTRVWPYSSWRAL
jgi:hypothetical protein